MHKIVNWLRCPQVWGFFVSVAVMALVALAFFYPDNFEGNALQQHDIQQGMANGHEAALYLQQTGEKALWTNSLMSGMPTFQISPSYWTSSLYGWINKAYGLWLPMPSNFLFMMMMGFFILLYCLKMRWPYALIGAIAWGFSSYFVIIIGAGHIWKFMALTYVPPTIGGLFLCYRGRYLLGGSLAALFAMMQLASNHPQMSYYFAFVMVALVLAFLAGAIKRRQFKQWGIASAVTVAAGLLAVGANLPSLYNTYEYSKETKRSQSELTPLQRSDEGAAADRPTGGLPKKEILAWSYGTGETFSLLVPNVRGGASAKPVGGRMAPMTMDKVDGAEKAPMDVAAITVGDEHGNPRRMPVLQYFSQYFNDSEGTNGPVYVGALVLALFFMGCLIVRGPVKWALVAVTALSVVLAWGYNCEWLSDLMIYHFPMYSKFRAVESILVIAEFTIPLLAIMGLYQFMTDKDKASSPRWMYAFAFCGAICLLAVVAPGVFGSAITEQDQSMAGQLAQYSPGFNVQRFYAFLEGLRHGMVRSDAWRSLFFVGAGFCLLWLSSRGGIKAGYALLGIGALVLCDLYTVDKRYVSAESFVPAYAAKTSSDPFAPDAIDRQILADTDLSYRVMDIPAFGSATRSYHHKMVGGYHAAKLNRFEDLIQRALAPTLSSGYVEPLRIDSVAAKFPTENQAAISALRSSYRVLDMLNARYIITGDDKQPLVLNPYALGNAWLVGDLKYADNADSEMQALLSIDPASEAVADAKFRPILGDEGAQPLDSADNIALVSYAPDRLVYSAKTAGDALAVFSEIYFPWGWHATVDGEPAPIARVDYTLRALRLPAGEHTVEMWFSPASLKVTEGISCACIIAIYLAFVLALALEARRRRKELSC